MKQGFMKAEETEKGIHKIAVLYILIMTVANAIGAFLPANFVIPTGIKSLKIWAEYCELHKKEISLLYSLNYIVPILSCFIYIYPKDKKKLLARFINSPYRFAGLGCLGWLVYIILDAIHLSIIKSTLKINIPIVLCSDLIFAVMMSFFCFTITFFTLEVLHRNIYLPRFFPEGKLSQYFLGGRASFYMKLRNFYITIAITPILLLISAYFSVTYENNLPIDYELMEVLGIYILLGIVLLCLISKYLGIPLKKMETAIHEIKDANYEYKINFISNDELGDLADVFNDMTSAIKNKNQRLSTIQDSIIKGMALMVESRDVNTGGHINRTSDCVKVFAKKLQKHPDYDHIPSSFFDKVIKAAPMHDLGKISVDDAVLRKPGKFTSEEYEMMKTHSAAGAKIVQQVIQSVEDEEFKQIAINVAHYHHEKWNGEGYPEGLKGEEIPFEARIMALADVFDALVSKRCYKDSFTYDKAFTIIEESLGSHFDPFLGLQFLACRKELEELYHKYEN